MHDAELCKLTAADRALPYAHYLGRHVAWVRAHHAARAELLQHIQDNGHHNKQKGQGAAARSVPTAGLSDARLLAWAQLIDHHLLGGTLLPALVRPPVDPHPSAADWGPDCAHQASKL